ERPLWEREIEAMEIDRMLPHPIWQDENFQTFWENGAAKNKPQPSTAVFDNAYRTSKRKIAAFFLTTVLLFASSGQSDKLFPVFNRPVQRLNEFEQAGKDCFTSLLAPRCRPIP